ncbi:Transcriptional regulator protein [Salinisphaera shabanensis E1L3A]|uniref:Transcriptional regulator protein n=1 Tax=Salinisphaera shabanensis E1L3A TaxID=1033802 RepID=U2G3H4_9GAMM|nr:AraC family transcriptional regulator [Salinisphaera shabanensis]ERJ20678.1 Transcriptional regulator protein [Salinisphaera shabanensis E1L3A]
MIDPLAEVVSLLQPSMRFSKLIVGAGPWRVHRSDPGDLFYCVVLEGECLNSPGAGEPIRLTAGDFLLAPMARHIVASSQPPPPADVEDLPVALGGGAFRLGAADAAPDVRMLIGHCHFESPDAALLISLLPQRVHVRGQQRLAMLVELLGEESRADRPARDMVLSRLLEVLMIEALRASGETAASSGLVRGLADSRLASAIRAMHAEPTRAWTVAELASQAAMSRSAFFERFNRTVGLAPMAYLLAWRMALAKRLLRDEQSRITDVAERVGYSSASTFSVAFTRHVGMPPTRYAHDSTSVSIS